MILRFIQRKKQLIIYGAALALLLFLLKWLQLRLVIINHSFEIYIGSIALIFTALGVWLALKLGKPKVEKVILEKEVFVYRGDFTRNMKALEELSLTKRELQVLELMAKGLSNNEIAENLFVSLSTVKTHSKNLFDKMGVERRTQAIDKAKKLNIIP